MLFNCRSPSSFEIVRKLKKEDNTKAEYVCRMGSNND